MKPRHLALALVLSAGLASCTTDPVDPGPTPTPTAMTFKQGARYEFNSYQTDPTTAEKVSATERTRTWTLINKSATVFGRAGVAIYVDSVVAGGPILTVADSAYLQQPSGDNYVFRYASLAPELDFTGASVVDVDLGKQWMQEARLNATTARWFVGESADTVQIPGLAIPGLQGIKVGVGDSSVASAKETITIGGVAYEATRTTHKLELSISALVSIPVLGVQALKLKSESLTRTTWMVPSLGAIAREERDGKVIDVSATTISGVSIPGFTLPVPGYKSSMTRVLATGN